MRLRSWPEGLTYGRDAVRREPFALRNSYFVNELTDDLSTAMVKWVFWDTVTGDSGGS
jgi:hypothetical protein